MHTLVEVPVGTNGGTHVPAFLAKLWKIVDDPSTNDLICWSDMGNSFIIRNQAKFARDLLPLYYKHNNMASFVRQLNMYGFHKVVSVEQGGLRVDKDEMEFAHPFFLKGQEASLELIKRKIPASKHEESRMRPDSFNKVLLDVRQMKGRQETMDNKLLTMKRENEALWRELASLRQKHAKQTQIVSKLLQFLVGMMSQQTPRLAFKRRMPLMLNDKEGLKQKLARPEAAESTGPVIHDVTELLESDDSAEDSGDQECVVDPTIVANIVGKSAFADVVSQNRLSPEELLFSVNPAALNPTVEMPLTPTTLHQHIGLNADKSKQASAKPKGKSPVKKNAPTPASLSSTNNVAFPNTPQQTMSTVPNTVQPQQLLQIPSFSAPTMPPQAQNNVPTTLYFSAPGMTEPVQVVLSLPDQATTTTPSPSGMTNITTPIIVPSTSSSTATLNKAVNMQPQPAMNTVPLTKATHVNNGPDVIGRSQTVNPKILMKSNGSVGQHDLDGHLDEVEVELNNLRDLFKTDEYPMDSNTFIGLFDGSQIGAGVENAENQNQANQNFQMNFQGGVDVNNQGQEVVTYNPSLFELAEEDSNFFDESSNVFLDDELESMLTTDRDSLKRPDGQPRGVGQITFSGINLNPSLDSGLNTPISESTSLPGTSTAGINKRKRK